MSSDTPRTPFGDHVIPIIGRIHSDGEVDLTQPWPAARPTAVAALHQRMYPTPEAREAETRERHRRWIAELSDHDWVRIRALAREVKPGFTPARLEDLDAKGLAVGVCAVGDERYFSGERIGVVRDGQVAVLVWEK